MSIRLRLAVAFAIATLIVASGAGALVVHTLDVSFNRSSDIALSRRSAGMERLLLKHRGMIGFTTSGRANADSNSATRVVLGQLVTDSGHVDTSTAPAGGTPIVNRAQLLAGSRGVVRFTGSAPGVPVPLRLSVGPAPGLPGYLLIVGMSFGNGTVVLDQVRRAFLVSLAPLTLLAGVAAYLLARATLRPVERMRQQAAVISERDSAMRLTVPDSGDEIASLGATINDLLDRMHTSLEKQRTFASDAGHELRTPLSILLVELELAQRSGRSIDELRSSIDAAHEEVERLSRLVEDMLLLARGDDDQLSEAVLAQESEVEAVVESALNGLRVNAAHRRVEVVYETTGSTPRSHGSAERPDLLDPRSRPLTASISPIQLRRVLDNLLSNAIDHAPDESTVKVRANVVDDSIVFEVEDVGPGFPPEYLPLAFDRFRRPDVARSRSEGGVGLGLAIVKQIVESHGGSVEALNKAAGGALVRFRLPNATGARRLGGTT